MIQEEDLLLGWGLLTDGRKAHAILQSRHRRNLVVGLVLRSALESESSLQSPVRSDHFINLSDTAAAEISRYSLLGFLIIRVPPLTSSM